MDESFGPLFAAADTPAEETPLSVAELTARIRTLLQEHFREVYVVGEISNLRRPTSGHIYFTLKDENAQIRVVAFRHMQGNITCELEEGMKVRVKGGLSVYGARGEYQVVADSVTPDGLGPLQQAFLQLKRKLEKEGLFDPSHKRPIPPHPSVIAVVTSPTGAAVRDILRVIRERARHVDVIIYPVRVQGDGAAAEICAAIRHLNDMGGVDTIIVGRGGGSIEDLWAFNEEIVARAIHESTIPVISAVGHEIDVTISDLVADKRALTPTEAGKIAVPDARQTATTLENIATAMFNALKHEIIDAARRRMDILLREMKMYSPTHVLTEKVQKLDELSTRMSSSMKHRVEMERKTIDSLQLRLHSLNPLSVMKRGFSITLGEDGRILRSHRQAKPGETIRTVLKDGEIYSTVSESKEARRSESDVFPS